MEDEKFICEVMDRCSDHPEKCESCKRNRGKRSYYVAENPLAKHMYNAKD